MENMFYINEDGMLTFDKLRFEILIGDILEETNPKNIKDLEWMVKKMVDAVQLCAWEYVNDSDDIEDEWEDIFCEY